MICIPLFRYSMETSLCKSDWRPYVLTQVAHSCLTPLGRNLAARAGQQFRVSRRGGLAGVQVSRPQLPIRGTKGSFATTLTLLHTKIFHANSYMFSSEPLEAAASPSLHGRSAGSGSREGGGERPSGLHTDIKDKKETCFWSVWIFKEIIKRV